MASLSISSCLCSGRQTLIRKQKPLFSKMGFSNFGSPAQAQGDPHWKLLQRKSSAYEGVPAELTEDSKFIPLNTDAPKYGPPALLLLGFQVQEGEGIQQLLKELDGEFLRVIFCTENMFGQTLWEAVNSTKQLEASKVAAASTSLPRICFLSGLTGEEMMMFIDAFSETDLEPPIFAAMVPNSAHKPISELAQEIMGDHQMLAEAAAIQ